MMSRAIVGDEVVETTEEKFDLKRVRRTVQNLGNNIRRLQSRREDLLLEISAMQTERDEWIAFRDTLDI